MTAFEDGAALKAWTKGSAGPTNAQKAYGQDITSPEDREQEAKAQEAKKTTQVQKN